MALMAAEELGIDPKLIQPLVGDTEAVGFTDVTEGSRATFATGLAVVRACQKLVIQLKERACIMWECSVDDIEWVDGSAVHKEGKKPPLTLAEITSKAKKLVGLLMQPARLKQRDRGLPSPLRCVIWKLTLKLAGLRF